MIGKSTFDDIDAGVSPVVGVILMVAVTVILAAVIGTFVLDLGGNVSQNAQAGVTFDENVGTDVTVQLNSVQSADHIYVQSDASVNTDGVNSDGTSASTDGQYLLSGSNGGVGTTVSVDTSGAGSAGNISVIGILDGEESVIQTYEYSV